jgi:hypothetical protein
MWRLANSLILGKEIGFLPVKRISIGTRENNKKKVVCGGWLIL